MTIAVDSLQSSRQHWATDVPRSGCPTASGCGTRGAAALGPRAGSRPGRRRGGHPFAILVHPARLKSATASASLPVPAVSEGADSAWRWAFCERLRQAMLSDTALLMAARRASGQTGGTANDWPSPAVLRQGLVVEVKPPGPDDLVEVSITCRADEAGKARQLASALAEEAITWAAAERSQAQLASRHAVQAAVEQARKRYRDAQTRFESFLDSHFAEHRSLAASAGRSQPQADKGSFQAGTTAGSAPPTTEAPKGGTSVDDTNQREAEGDRGRQPHSTGSPAPAVQNPQWQRLDRELEGLRSELAIMLIERTTAHPAVQDLQRRIRELEIHLESIPRFLTATETPEHGTGAKAAGSDMARWSPRQATSAGGAEDTPSAPAAAEATRHAEAAQEYAKYKGAWLAAAAELDQAEEQQRQTWARWSAPGTSAADCARLRLPEIAFAERRHPTGSYLAALALAAGVTVAFGTLLLSAGLDMDVPLASAREARKCLPAPVIGVVRVASEKPAVATSSSSNRRLGLIAAGSLVLAGCVALVAVAL